MNALSSTRPGASQSICSEMRECASFSHANLSDKNEFTHKLLSQCATQQFMSVFVVLFVLFSLLLSQPVFALEPGDTLNSDASVSYRYNGVAYTQSSDAPFIVDSFANQAPPAPGTPATLDVWGPVNDSYKNKDLQVTQSQCSSAVSGSATALTYADGSALTLPALVPALNADIFKAGNPLIVRVVDQDENINNNQIDSVTVQLIATNPSDTETLVLFETTADSGEFVGIIQTRSSAQATLQDCLLDLAPSSELTVNYQDQQDQQDTVNTTNVFDRYNKVFNAFTGELVDGVTIRLIDNTTGLPARIFGDDGISAFPSVIESGAKVEDSSGKIYDFPTGSYRFPYVPNGEYRIEVNNTFAYQFPAKSSDLVLQTLPNAPFNLTPLSKGTAQTSSNLLLNADIPLDPLLDRILINKSTPKATVGIADFVPFEISMTNIDATISNLKLIDTLPVGLRFVKGSLKVNGETYSDVEISENGQQIVVNFPTLTPLQVIKVTYISQVSATAKGKLTNVVEISHPILKSNIASADVDIRDDLMRDKAQVFGRIILDDCDGNLDAEGLEGVRILMEDGRYVVSDEQGRWHFEGLKPGAHVVQLDTTTLPAYLEPVACDKDFFHAGQSYSQFIDVQPGTLWRADFHVQPKKPENGDVLQTLFNQLVPLSPAERLAENNSLVDKKVQYTANVGGSGVALNNVIEEIRLPKGVVMQAASLTLDGAPYPYEYRDNTVFIQLGDKPTEWSHEIQFSAFITANAEKGTLAARAILHYEIGPILKDSTPLAETRLNLFVPPLDGKADPLKNPKFESLSNVLTAEDKNNLSDVINTLEGLKDLEIAVSGHTDNVPIAKRNQHIYADNKALSEARASAVAEYISEQIGLPIEKIKINGLGKSSPLVSNGTTEGRAKNRRVEVRVLKANADVELASLDMDVKIAKTETLIPGLDIIQATAANNPENQIHIQQQPIINDAWFADKNIEKNWVWPPLAFSPDISATNVLIQHPKNNRVRLTLNGVAVHSIYFEGIKRAKNKAVSVSEWRGINIEEGENNFVAEILDRNDQVIDYLAQSIYFSGAPTHVELLPEMSTLIADGIQTPIIAVRLKDKNGYPVRKNTQGEIQISEPFELLQRSEYDINPLSDTNKLSYRVEGDGIAFIRLQPTTQTGELTVKFDHGNGLTDEIRPWLIPAARDWILVGLGDLTLGAHSTSNNAKQNSNGTVDDNIFHQGRLAFYTKGQIPGDYLITAAYDSNKEKTTPFAALVQPGEYYTLYADASQQGQDASSGDKLYIKIEKKRFYAMYGDISTGLDKTKLAKYVRNLTGVQTVFQNDLVELSAFASEADSNFVRDEIAANGTSGLYKLSNKNIVLNSENIRIETRDRLNNQRVLNSKTLKRFLDYSLNSTDGSLYFKSPIATTDNDFNPIYIVADYETENAQGGHLIGGRSGIKLLNDTLTAGVTVIDENKGNQNNQLNAVDATLKLGNVTLTAEVAQTRPAAAKSNTINNASNNINNGSATNTEKASAKRIEAKLRTATSEVTAYSQRIEQEFGLNQQNQVELGKQTSGINATVYLNKRDQLELKGLYQTDINSGYDKQFGAATLTRKISQNSTIKAGVQSNTQETENGLDFVEELVVGASTPMFSKDFSVNVTATTDITERSEENDRLKLGSEYRWNDTLTSFANYERSFNTNNLERTAIGLRTQPWQGGQVEQSMVQEKQNDGYRLFTESGLSHDWKVDKHWLVSFGFNQSKNLEQASPAEETASEDFHAISTGWSYRSKQWQWTNRIERRIAASSQVHSVQTSLYHPLNRHTAIGGSLSVYKQANQPGFEQNTNAIIDFAIRPYQQPFAVLLQTRLIEDLLSLDYSNPTDKSRRIINNAHLNWMFKRGHQLSTQYGFKRVLEQYSRQDLASTVHYIAGEWRHQLNQTWDIGAHGRELISTGSQQQNSYGLSIGARPVKNLWASIGYNFEGFIDNDFSAANYTAQGVYLKLRFKADQDTLASLRQAFNW